MTPIELLNDIEAEAVREGIIDLADLFSEVDQPSSKTPRTVLGSTQGTISAKMQNNGVNLEMNNGLSQAIAVKEKPSDNKPSSTQAQKVLE